MRHLAIVLAAVLVLVTAAGVAAHTPVGDLPGNGLVVGSGEGTTIPAGRTDFIEGWNVGETPQAGCTYSGHVFGLMYCPGQTYWLDRVEFVAGGIPGTAMIQIVEDDGSGLPTGPVLAEGTFNQIADFTWQGADMDRCVFIEEGVLYWVKYYIVVDSNCSIATSGVKITYYWSFNDVNWYGPWENHSWMAKFYGGYQPSANEASTWGGVKSLLR